MAENTAGATQAPQKSATPAFDPSDFLLSYQDQPFVKYSNYPVDFYNSLKSTDFTETSKFKGKMPLKSLTALVNEFNALDLNQLISEPTELIKEFKEYALDQFEPESYKFIVNFYYPLIVPEKTKKIVLLMVKIVHLVKEPNKVLTWFTKCVLPPTFTRQTKQNIIAVSRCKQGKKQNFWAVIDSENMFYFYQYKGEDFVEKIKGKVEKISQGKDKISVEITSGTKVICKFTPEDPKHVALWVNTAKAPVNIIDFFTAFNNPAVDQIYQVAYTAIANADSLILRSLLSPECSSPKDVVSKAVIKAFLDVFTHSGKIIEFVNAVFITEIFDQDQDLNRLVDEPTHTRNMFEYIYSIYGLSYHQVFIKKLADYIIETNGYGINSKDVDLPAFERFINTITKYIVSSVDELPPVVKQMLGILRTYVVVRTNSCKDIYDIVGSMFFESFIIPGLTSYGSGTPENRTLMSRVVFILRVIFRLGKMNGKLQFLDALNLRLEKHIYPKLMEFIFTISEVPEQEFVYEEVQPVKIARGIENILRVISAKHEAFRNVYTQLEDPLNANSKTTILGAAVASLMTTFFLYQFDSEPPAKEEPENWDDPPRSPKKIKRLVKLTDETQVPENENLIHRIMRVNQVDLQTYDPTRSKKYYKRIIKKPKMGEK